MGGSGPRPAAGVRLEVETSRGLAEARVLSPAGRAAGLAVLGHGAGGGVDAPDLVAVTDALVAADIAVALVTQPYRVAGRRSPPPAPALDEAWLAVLEALRGPVVPGELPLVCGGRSSGARVACRTAAATRAVGVVALAFPLQPPTRGAPSPTRPRPSRAPELRAALDTAPVLVVQGAADPFGGPQEVVAALDTEGESRARLDVRAVAGADHSLRAGRPRRVPECVPRVVAAAVRGWLAGAGSRGGIAPAAHGVGAGAGGRPPEDP